MDRLLVGSHHRTAVLARPLGSTARHRHLSDSPGRLRRETNHRPHGHLRQPEVVGRQSPRDRVLQRPAGDDGFPAGRERDRRWGDTRHHDRRGQRESHRGVRGAGREDVARVRRGERHRVHPQRQTGRHPVRERQDWSEGTVARRRMVARRFARGLPQGAHGRSALREAHVEPPAWLRSPPWRDAAIVFTVRRPVRGCRLRAVSGRRQHAVHRGCGDEHRHARSFTRRSAASSVRSGR